MGRVGFSKRLRNVMDDRGIRQADLLRAAAEQGRKLGKSQLSQYVSGKTMPRADVLSLLAELLGVDAG